MLLGLVQLEALESVSSTSEQKVRRFMEMLPKDAAESLKAELLQIRQVFDNVQANSDDGLFLCWHSVVYIQIRFWPLICNLECKTNFVMGGLAFQSSNNKKAK